MELLKLTSCNREQGRSEVYTRVTRGGGGGSEVSSPLNTLQRAKRDLHAELLSRDHLNASHSKTLSPFFLSFYTFLFVPLHSHRILRGISTSRRESYLSTGVTLLAVGGYTLVGSNNEFRGPSHFFRVLNSVL